MPTDEIAIVGGGPAGLAAAEVLSSAGRQVTVYDAMPSVARKFLLAGKSGLNITHSEELPRFLQRFSACEEHLAPAIRNFTPDNIRQWAADLGTETFVGSSGRVFPRAMKASPLLRAWLGRLKDQGVAIRTRHRWTGFCEDGLAFDTMEGVRVVSAGSTLLALGGASWPRLGSDASWIPWLRGKGVAVHAFQPANCGFDVSWSPLFREKFAGAPIKSVEARSDAGHFPGEFVATQHGIEGSLVYAHSSALRDRLRSKGEAAMVVDLTPGRSIERLKHDLERQSPKASFATRLKKAAGLGGVKVALLRELLTEAERSDQSILAARIKALSIPVDAPRPIAEAISSAGGVCWSAVDQDYMLRELPGVFVAGEMIDWEAPTGGYLLTACLASGRAAARGMLRRLSAQRS